MYSEIENLADRFDENFEESGTDILLKWNTWPSTVTLDPVTEEKSAPAVPMTECIKAFLYFVSATSTIRQNAEVETGDCIVDFPACVDLSNREDMVVVITPRGGPPSEWVTKPMSGKLQQAWTEMQGGIRLYNTILLRKAT